MPEDADLKVTAEVTEDGLIKIGEHLVATLDQAARAANADGGSGWELMIDGQEPVPLSSVRVRA